MSEWVLILGCSTGHGGATTRKLAEDGYGIIGFHFDRGDIKKEAEAFCEELKGLNDGRVHFFNKNAADINVMKEFIPQIEEITGGEPLKLFLHSIAFGTTTNFFGERPVTQKQMEMTVHGYGPVSVAKVALESITRQIGWELGKHGITANCIQAGVTPTRALTKITENWEEWVEKTERRNPMGRTTQPEDVANVVHLLLQPGADFINCSIVYTDGGEHRSGSFD